MQINKPNTTIVAFLAFFLIIGSCKKKEDIKAPEVSNKESIKAAFLEVTDVRWLPFVLEKTRKENPKLDKRELGEAGIANLNLLFKVQDLIKVQWIDAGGTESELKAIQTSFIGNLKQQLEKPGFKRPALDTAKWDSYITMLITAAGKSSNNASAKTGKSGGKIMWSDYDLQEIEIRGCPVPDVIRFFHSMGPQYTLMTLIDQYGYEVGSCKAGVILAIMGGYQEVLQGVSTCPELAGRVGGLMQELELCNLRGLNPGGGDPGSGNGGNVDPTNQTIELNFEGEKVNPKEETKCFDKNEAGKMTIFVQQPNENTRDMRGPNSVGHAFIGIEQGGITRYMGFYPNSPNASVISDQVSEIHNNSGTMHHVSISKDLTAQQMKDVVEYVSAPPGTYSLRNFNCTDFAIAVASRGGLSLPSTTGSTTILGFMNFSGRNPGDLGQDIRGMSLPSGVTRSTTKANAPSKQGTCPQ